MALRWREWLGFKPTLHDFAVALLEGYGREGFTGWTFDAEDRSLRRGDGTVINLGNIYLEYVQAPRAQRVELLKKYIGFAKIQQQSIPKLWTLAAKNIYPVLRSRYDRSLIQIQLRNQNQTFPDQIAWPWFDDLEIRIAYDFGAQLAQVQANWLETWGQSQDEVRKVALQNLAALPRAAWAEAVPGVFQVVSEASYEESLLLLPKTFEPLPFKDRVACIPSNRGILFACDATIAAHVVAMLELAIIALQEKPWPLAATVLRRSGNAWQTMTLEAEAQAKLEDLRRLNLANVYSAQKGALEKHFRENGTDVFVATYGLFRRKDDGGAIRSWCSWTDGIASSLPKSDVVILGRADEAKREPVLLPWARAEQILGHRMKDAGEDPPRYLVEGDISAAEWASAQSAAATEP